MKPAIFRGLRVRLTLLYLLVALAFVALIGGGTYGLLGYYFQTTTDLALKHKMAHELRAIGASVPVDLQAADVAWNANRTRLLPGVDSRTGAREVTAKRDHDEGEGRRRQDEDEAEEAYDGELAATFVLPLDATGRVLSNPNPAAPLLVPDAAAARSALDHGSDLRTTWLGETRVRLLTYWIPRSVSPTLLQVGRSLSDQDRILGQLLFGLLGMGGFSAVLLAGGSWWMAGRSLAPAQLAWERQQAFVANASHELRTPLTLIRASAESAEYGLASSLADRRSLLRDIVQECDHMSRLVEDLLLLSRLDAGVLPLDRREVDVRQLLSDVQHRVGRLAQDRGVSINLDGATALVWGDPERLQQVLLILLDNALRHTPPHGEIRLEAKPSGRQVQLTVADTGPGIPPEHIPLVFERFYRVDGARGSETGGAGLGLAIAKALITAQSGEIEIESGLGKGTSVRITLPKAANDAR